MDTTCPDTRVGRASGEIKERLSQRRQYIENEIVSTTDIQLSIRRMSTEEERTADREKYWVLRYDAKDPLARFDREEMAYDPQRELLQCLCEYDRLYGDRKIHNMAAELVRIPLEWRTHPDDDPRRYTNATNVAYKDTYENPFHIPRDKLLTHLKKMRLNWAHAIAVSNGEAAPLRGGIPGAPLSTMHSIAQLHCIPIAKMGDYKAYERGIEKAGYAPLRELFDNKPKRKDPFGNPFKVEKASASIDDSFEVEEKFIGAK